MTESENNLEMIRVLQNLVQVNQIAIHELGEQITNRDYLIRELQDEIRDLKEKMKETRKFVGVRDA